jgi:hypothetical protein
VRSGADVVEEKEKKQARTKSSFVGLGRAKRERERKNGISRSCKQSHLQIPSLGVEGFRNMWIRPPLSPGFSNVARNMQIVVYANETIV